MTFASSPITAPRSRSRRTRSPSRRPPTPPPSSTSRSPTDGPPALTTRSRSFSTASRSPPRSLPRRRQVALPFPQAFRSPRTLARRPRRAIRRRAGAATGGAAEIRYDELRRRRSIMFKIPSPAREVWPAPCSSERCWPARRWSPGSPGSATAGTAKRRRPATSRPSSTTQNRRSTRTTSNAALTAYKRADRLADGQFRRRPVRGWLPSIPGPGRSPEAASRPPAAAWKAAKSPDLQALSRQRSRCGPIPAGPRPGTTTRAYRRGGRLLSARPICWFRRRHRQHGALQPGLRAADAVARRRGRGCAEGLPGGTTGGRRRGLRETPHRRSTPRARGLRAGFLHTDRRRVSSSSL